MSIQKSKSPDVDLVGRSKFEAKHSEALNSTVENILQIANGRKGLSGWQFFSDFEISSVDVNGRSILTVPTDKTSLLLEAAEHNPYLFDLASYIAGTYLVILSQTGIEISKPISNFGARALIGEITRPSIGGGRIKGDPFLRAWQYILCVRTSNLGGLGLSRADSKHSDGFSACDAVAEAFTKSGKYTTYVQMKSLCFDKGYKQLRELVFRT